MQSATSNWVRAHVIYPKRFQLRKHYKVIEHYVFYMTHTNTSKAHKGISYRKKIVRKRADCAFKKFLRWLFETSNRTLLLHHSDTPKAIITGNMIELKLTRVIKLKRDFTAAVDPLLQVTGNMPSCQPDHPWLLSIQPLLKTNIQWI